MNLPRRLSGRKTRLDSPAEPGRAGSNVQGDDGDRAGNSERARSDKRAEGTRPTGGTRRTAGANRSWGTDRAGGGDRARSSERAAGGDRETGGDRAAEHDAYMRWVAATVGEHGWAISGRHGDQVAPPWSYSVGMWLSCQAPELLLCGLPVENGAAIINAIGARIADGAGFAAGDVLGDICPAPLALRPVDASWRAPNGLLAISDAFYGMVRPPYLQVVWSDRNGRFPWEPGFQAAYDRLQPLLWLPRDDNPPCAWTRLERLP